MFSNPLQIHAENVHSLLAGGNAELVGDPTWLYPILLPSITDTLMGLYRVHYAVDNKKLSATLRDLNGKADDELCELLKLQRSVFFTCPGYLDPAMHNLLRSYSEHEHWKKSGHFKTFTELFDPVTQIFSKIGWVHICTS